MLLKCTNSFVRTVFMIPEVSPEWPGDASKLVETFYTILLNSTVAHNTWMAGTDQPHERLTFPEEVLPRGNAL